MARIFIADPALKTYQGHHYNVTLAFSLSLKEQGHEVIIIANQDFDINNCIGVGVVIKPVFDTDTYSKHKDVKTKVSSSSESVNLLTPPMSIVSRIESFIIKNKTTLRRMLPEHRLMQAKRILRNYIFKSDSYDEPLSSTGVKNIKTNSVLSAFYECNILKDDFVFFHTSDAVTYKDIHDMFVKDTEINSWSSLPCIFLSSPYDENIMPHNKQLQSANISVRRLKKLQLINSKIFLFAENEILAKHMSNYFDCQVGSLYLPFKEMHNAPKKNIENSKITFSYLGAARSEKGFVLVTKAIIKYLSINSRNDVRFLIQASPQILGYTYDIKKAVDELKSTYDKRLELVYESQSPEEYDKSIVDTDCFFICYNYANYQYRSSGIVIEALVSAKNAIVTKGTFPDKILGDAGISIENVDDIVLAIDNFINQKDQYAEKALNRKKWFMLKSSSNDLHSKIEDISKIKSAVIGERECETKESIVSLNYKKLL